MLNLFSNIFGSSNDRILKKMMLHVSAANNLEDELSKKPDSYFKDLKNELKSAYKENDKNLYTILPLDFYHSLYKHFKTF